MEIKYKNEVLYSVNRYFPFTKRQRRGKFCPRGCDNQSQSNRNQAGQSSGSNSKPGSSSHQSSYSYGSTATYAQQNSGSEPFNTQSPHVQGNQGNIAAAEKRHQQNAERSIGAFESQFNGQNQGQNRQQ
ncbi:hypothetical protein MCOR27_011365 [Pyricularia oryzae]|nr:hypothetical protein MCOR19_007650 [Pyricularia oryzae]KAI6263938.1 hypothetical protein MCOR26_011721 [Pyricularia oryzae]KAI6265540.1 hypothetical protein MCOR27_011365 [Pyricularia oryzae]KAI6351205.1 hypothetical protein MCOR32_011705 [Pyricularia oryzae]KAI6361903.1 hypothetical protein MCOR31_008477 [Pyricularia oryzae]